MTNDQAVNPSDPSLPYPDTLRLRKGQEPHAPVNDGDVSETIPNPQPVFVGDYEILGEIARGGMGIVYKARQRRLNRIVALKLTQAGHLATPEDLMRLHTEATSAAKLDHPNIVPIYEVGEADGRRFLSMAYIEGQSLEQAIAAGPLPPRRAAELIKQVAHAVAYAHQHGVIHRDLKPTNILLDVQGQPRVSDFGLAKCTETDSGLTQVGQIMGTPSFMPPEQTEGKTELVGPPADIYALGATLYHLVTGRPPFQAATPLETIKQVVEREPISPRLLNPAIDRDLDTIRLKCLQKRPERRYATASALADDLQRFLEQRPILARPVGRFEKLRRWQRRNPSLAAALLGTLSIFLVALLLVSRSYFQAENALAEAQLKEKGERWARYRSDMNAATAALQLHNVGAARRALDDAPHEHRNWEWRHFHNQLDLARHVLRDSQGVPTAGMVAVRGGRGFVVFNPGHIQAWDIASRRLLGTYPFRDTYESKVSDDGRFIARVVSATSVEVRDIDVEKEPVVLTGHVSPITSLRFLGDGKRLAASARDGVVRGWDLRSGQPLQVFRGHKADVAILDVSADNRRILSIERRESICRVWDASTAKEIANYAGHEKTAILGAFNSRGDRLVTVENDPTNTIRLWETETGKPLAVMRGHESYVHALAFSPDGTRLATGSGDYNVRIWDTLSAQERANMP